MNICIAGANGFIGKALCQNLSDRHLVFGITRERLPVAAQNLDRKNGIQLRSANLFSLLELERAMEGGDVAVYLVHSMLPSSRLTQGSFEDLDAILADNFARAAKAKGIKRIVYLSGLMPEGNLSPHLRSRKEVECILASHGVPVVSLRAGLVIGPGSSSFRIMENLVGRLPILICPSWTSKLCQPISLCDVVEVLTHVIEDPLLPAESYDIGGPDVLSYVDMMGLVAQQLHVKRWFFRVPFVSKAISRLWVSTVTATPKALVYPLIESLEHSMVAKDRHLQARYHLVPISFTEALRRAFHQDLAVKKTTEVLPPKANENQARQRDTTVISVQRLPLAKGRSVSWVANEYARWLPQFLNPLLRVESLTDGILSFIVCPLGSKGPRWQLLELTYSAERSSSTRQLYYITGGSLLKRVPGRSRGRLEFRAIAGRSDCIAAVLDFRPRLPWWIYKVTQANAHLLVMYFFALHLRLSKKLDETMPEIT